MSLFGLGGYGSSDGEEERQEDEIVKPIGGAVKNVPKLAKDSDLDGVWAAFDSKPVPAVPIAAEDLEEDAEDDGTEDGSEDGEDPELAGLTVAQRRAVLLQRQAGSTAATSAAPALVLPSASEVLHMARRQGLPSYLVGPSHASSLFFFFSSHTCVPAGSRGDPPHPGDNLQAASCPDGAGAAGGSGPRQQEAGARL